MMCDRQRIDIPFYYVVTPSNEIPINRVETAAETKEECQKASSRQQVAAVVRADGGDWVHLIYVSIALHVT